MKKSIIYYALSALCLIGCADDMAVEISNQTMPIQIASTYPVVGATRVTDNGFVANDAVGIFVVDYNKDGTPGVPGLKGNRASNVKFIYDGGSWAASYQLYWADGAKTPADFYGYYPYDIAMSSVTDYPFAVDNNQDSTATSSGYEASDLLWAKAEKVAPTTDVVNLKYKHLMAGITVSLEMGSGFTAAEWNELEKVVLIENTVTGGTVDLSKGTCTLGNGTVEPIKPLIYNGVWRAVVFPQSVAAGKTLLSITVDGQNYSLVKGVATTYLSGKMHNFTITVNRSEATGDFSFALKTDDIVAWVDDPNLHDGLVYQYVVVNVDEPGTLENEIREKYEDYGFVKTLKINGLLNHKDLRFIGEHLTRLTALNLSNVTITGTEEEKDVFTLYKYYYTGDTEDNILSHIVLPNKLKKIADNALTAVGLVGSISIPEGVEYIGVEAFCGNRLKGEIKLPSSLKILRGGAFAFNSFSGNLYLPDGLEIIGPKEYGAQDYDIFMGSNFEGPLLLPSNLKEYGGLGFSGTTGTLVIPKFLTEIDATVDRMTFKGGGYDKIEFHDGITSILGGAFIGSSLSGELVLPPNLKPVQESLKLFFLINYEF